MGVAAINLRSNESYRLARDAVWAIAMYIASLTLPIPLVGLVAFGAALGMLGDCISSPATTFAGDWLLGLSWLANPAAWAGMVFLLVGRARRAALCGEVALLLAVCALRLHFLNQYIWLASMVYVVYAALRVPDQALAASSRILARIRLLKPHRIFYPAVALPAVFGLVLLFLVERGFIRSALDNHGFEPNDSVRTGKDAKLRILDLAQRAARPGVGNPQMPASANNFWLYDGGNFNGSITYWTFDCANREECLKAVESLGSLRPKDLKSWKPSGYAVVMKGPAFYSRDDAPNKKLRSNPWDVRGIKNGLVYEGVRGDHDSMTYFAIDLDRNRVYHHYESGGFSPEEYEPNGERGRDVTESK
jgi:hypothetical protein